MKYFSNSCRYFLFGLGENKNKGIYFTLDKNRNVSIRLINIITILLIINSMAFSQTGTWIKISENACKNIAIIGDSVILAHSNSGIELSSDGGKTWVPKQTPFAANRVNLIAVNDSTNSVFIYDYEKAIIYKSTDYANSWISSLENKPSITSLIVKNGILYATGYSGQLYMSKNDGDLWDSINVIANLKSVKISDSGRIFVITGNDQILISNDNGKTWNKLKNKNSDTFPYPLLISNNDKMFFQSFSNIYVSNDLGVTWESRPIPLNLPYEIKIAIDDENNLYYVQRFLLKSSDSGLNWTLYGGPFYTFNGITVANNNMYIATYEGIFHYDQSIPIYVGNKYFPLHLGNTWQYLSYYSSYGDPNSYELVEDRITTDTLINNSQYYSYRRKWVRYSEVDKKIFIRDGDSDKIYMNFNLPPLGIFQQFNGKWESLAAVIDGSKNLFNDTVKFKGYVEGNMMTGRTQEIFGENIGAMEYSYESTYGPDVSDGSFLIMAILYDSTNTPTYLSNHYKPEINFTPINLISTSEFQINFMVNHKFSRIYDPIPKKIINFINSVYMISNYSKGDSVINNNTLFAVNTEKTNKYLISSVIDTTILKDGFTFNYKIIAKDKGIIPETSSSPDTGYYKIKWGTTSIDDIDNKIITFELGQNYPNPFNPISVITYSVPVDGKVMLRVYDILGNEIAILVNSQKHIGQYEVLFDGSNLPSGIYFYRLQLGKLIQTKKMILLK